MSWAYLACLAVSLAGMLALDARFRLFLWRSPWRAAAVLAIGLAFFVAWDLVGIALGIFKHVDAHVATGLLVAPQLPIEEIVFLLFLCELSMVALVGSKRLLDWRAARPNIAASPAPTAASPARDGEAGQ